MLLVQAFLQLRETVLGRGSSDLNTAVASSEERRAACSTLSMVANHMRELRASAQHTTVPATWLPQFAMLSHMAEQLAAWLLGGPEQGVSILSEPGMQGVAESLPAEMLAAHRAVLHSC